MTRPRRWTRIGQGLACVVCQERQASDKRSYPPLCRKCQTSYDTTLGGTVAEVIFWAATRARRYERQRQRRKLS